MFPSNDRHITNLNPKNADELGPLEFTPADPAFVEATRKRLAEIEQQRIEERAEAWNRAAPAIA